VNGVPVKVEVMADSVEVLAVLEDENVEEFVV
jgi:hypothetical protein